MSFYSKFGYTSTAQNVDERLTLVEANLNTKVIGEESGSVFDDAIVRWDGTGGKNIQNSPATLTDGGLLTVNAMDVDNINSKTPTGNLNIEGVAFNAGKVNISDVSESTSAITGALTIAGGLGVAKRITTSSYFQSINPTNTPSNSTNSFLRSDGVAGAGWISLQAGSNSTSTGNAGNKVVMGNFAGEATIGAHNNAHTEWRTVFVGSNTTTSDVYLRGNNIVGQTAQGLSITSTVDSSSTATGSLRTLGGVGIAQTLRVGTNAYIGNQLHASSLHIDGVNLELDTSGNDINFITNAQNVNFTTPVNRQIVFYHGASQALVSKSSSLSSMVPFTANNISSRETNPLVITTATVSGNSLGDAITITSGLSQNNKSGDVSILTGSPTGNGNSGNIIIGTGITSGVAGSISFKVENVDKLVIADTLITSPTAIRITNGTFSTSSATGCLTTVGGIGCGGNLWVEGNASTSAVPTQSFHLTNKNYVDSRSAFTTGLTTAVLACSHVGFTAPVLNLQFRGYKIGVMAFVNVEIFITTASANSGIGSGSIVNNGVGNRFPAGFLPRTGGISLPVIIDTPHYASAGFNSRVSGMIYITANGDFEIAPLKQATAPFTTIHERGDLGSTSGLTLAVPSTTLVYEV